MANYNLVNGDCLDVLPEIPDNSIDMVLADLPYGTTACDWDSIIPLDELWEQYKRIGKDNTPYVFTATQPFTTKLIQSNMDWFKYEWIWQKNQPTGMVNAKYKPMSNHENVIVFYKNKPTYNPIKENRDWKEDRIPDGEFFNWTGGYGSNTQGQDNLDDNNIELDKKRNPTTVKQFDTLSNNHPNKTHPTQKPVALFEYLIKTYTNEGDLVLDNVMGSGTTGVACQKTDRRFLGIEQDEEYFEIAQERIEEAKNTDWERLESIEDWQKFDGIGEKTAETIYDELGSVEEADMEQLEFISGIGQKTAQSIREEYTND